MIKLLTAIFLPLIFILCMQNIVYGQERQPLTLNIGDAAPPLYIREWLKGKPIDKFEKGKIYVVEFWATWCHPCRAEMPRLSKLARKYKKTISVIGIDVYEKNVKPVKGVKEIKKFVDSMGRQMDYAVALEDSNFMESAWLRASNHYGIPSTFIVDAQGKLAWIGHPMNLDSILPKIATNKWDINEAIAKRASDDYLEKLDDSLGNALHRFHQTSPSGYPYYLSDSALIAIDEIIKKEPKLKYAPRIAFHTFSALLINNPQKAYEYGKIAIVTPTYDSPPYDQIIDVIKNYSADLNIPPEIYELGAEAYQELINMLPYPELVDLFKYYNKMAEWYERANNKPKAIRAQRKAIRYLRRRKIVSIY